MENSKKKVMIIEDDYFVLDIYHTKLTQAGFEVVDAKDGQDGLDKLKAEENLPDLILLDIVMPRLNGLEVLGEVKKDERLKSIPIILLTNLSQKAEIDKGMELGAVDYLIKSHFTPSEVLEKINSIIGNK
jgi:DNA-binding response OmpR family regulator